MVYRFPLLVVLLAVLPLVGLAAAVPLEGALRLRADRLGSEGSDSASKPC